MHLTENKTHIFQCPGCLKTLDDITLPDCPDCGQPLNSIFEPKLTFDEFKQYHLNLPECRREAKRRRADEAGRITGVMIWIAVTLFCCAADYGLFTQALKYHTVIDGIVGAAMACMCFAGLFSVVRIFGARARFNVNKCIGEIVQEDYELAVQDKKTEYASLFQDALVEKYNPATRVHRVLVSGKDSNLADGYKSVFMSKQNSLMLVEVWNAIERGFEIIEIPHENIISFYEKSLKKNIINWIFFLIGFDEEIQERAAVLEYSDSEGCTYAIEFFDEEGIEALRKLIPEKEAKESKSKNVNNCK